MDTDTTELDRMLAAAAPRGVQEDAGLRREIASMARSARAAAHPRRRRGMRVALGAVLATAMVGGAGVAVAGTVFDWAPWAQDADVVYAFELPSGRACEARVQVLEVTSVDEFGRVATSVNGELTEHFRSIDAIARIDIEAAVAQVRARDSGTAMVVLGADGRLEDVPATGAGPTDDDVYAAAIDVSLADVLHDEFDALGWGDEGWSANEDLQCAPVAP
ncbi:hypothetical protein DEU34_1227 [Microbacterium sp. AG1240]|uniref:hypothetical protein n=1 Tax=Microbacterium sp. AG1240 TaxID=2183992 RepID=UPI000EB0AEC0|nr:hypothetical protein [Microbacterium sp. AG1240]RKT36706.1 hypothetical protein DEU34_1227 [Microbacterium sp. AG1240]